MEKMYICICMFGIGYSVPFKVVLYVTISFANFLEHFNINILFYRCLVFVHCFWSLVSLLICRDWDKIKWYFKLSNVDCFFYCNIP